MEEGSYEQMNLGQVDVEYNQHFKALIHKLAGNAQKITDQEQTTKDVSQLG